MKNQSFDIIGLGFGVIFFKNHDKPAFKIRLQKNKFHLSNIRQMFVSNCKNMFTFEALQKNIKNETYFINWSR